MMPQVFSFQVLLRTENPSTVVATVAAADIGLVQEQVDGGDGCAVARLCGGCAVAAVRRLQASGCIPGPAAGGNGRDYQPN